HDLARAGLQPPDQHAGPGPARRGHGARHAAMSAPEARRIDWRQVRALVRAFLVMSVRKMPMRTLRGEKKGGGVGPILFLVGLYTLFGLLLIPILMLTKDVFLGSFSV